MGKRLILTLLVSLLMSMTVSGQDNVDTMSINYRYKQIYGFVTMPDTIYTFEGEFTVPTGFRHPDSSELTKFQNYVANFPLWHRFAPVGSFYGKRMFERQEISRPVHFPYSGPAFIDRAEPIRILAEYLHDQKREFELKVVPNSGDTMTFIKWIVNDITYGPNRTVQFVPGESKDPSLKEYYTFMRFCLENTTYRSLAFNCDSITTAEVRPGDLFVAHTDDGKKGVVFVIMHMIENMSGEKLYAVATGCERACDFHIPLFNNDKNNPWISTRQITDLGSNFSQKGFLRLKFH